jgi:hypothetical protein
LQRPAICGGLRLSHVGLVIEILLSQPGRKMLTHT